MREISGRLHIGTCKKICIPTVVDFHLSTKSMLDAIVVGRYEAVRDAFDRPVDAQFGHVVSAQRSGKHLLLDLKVPEEELEPQLFVDAEAVGFGLPEIVAATSNIRTYRVPILSGSLPDNVMIDYVMVGKSRSVGGRAILR